jgi:hypothetical protein
VLSKGRNSIVSKSALKQIHSPLQNLDRSEKMLLSRDLKLSKANIDDLRGKVEARKKELLKLKESLPDLH